MQLNEPERDEHPSYLRIGVYTDYTYHQTDGGTYAERAFAVFLNQLADHFASFKIIGRLDPSPGRARYRLAEKIEFVPLPFYGRLTQLGAVARATGRAMAAFWRAIDDLDVVWLLGPHPFVFGFGAMAWLRGRGVVLGVRQDSVNYMRWRHPGKRWHLRAARLMEWSFIQLGRFAPVVAVGPDIAARYGKSADQVLSIAVSLIRPDQLRDPSLALEKDYSGPLTVLSVGRLDAEKNPLLLVETIAKLHDQDERWRLVICGEGDLEQEMRLRVSELGLDEVVSWRGYLPVDDGLSAAYDSAHFLLHVSWTEGLPQILLEAFAHCLPVVATDVGGIQAAFGDVVKLVPPGDLLAPAESLAELADDPDERRELVVRARAKIEQFTIGKETARLADFVARSVSSRR